MTTNINKIDLGLAGGAYSALPAGFAFMDKRHVAGERTYSLKGRKTGDAASVDFDGSAPGNLYDLYIKIEAPDGGAPIDGMIPYWFLVEGDDAASLSIPELGVVISSPEGPLNGERRKVYFPEPGYYRVAIQLLNRAARTAADNMVALNVCMSPGETPIPLGDYSGNTYTNSFSSAPKAPLYIIAGGTVKPKDDAPDGGDSDCDCGKDEGSSTGKAGCAKWDMAFGTFPMIAGMPSASIRSTSTSSARMN